MKKTKVIRSNTKNQNGSKNPVPGKEFTPNGMDWIWYYEPNI